MLVCIDVIYECTKLEEYAAESIVTGVSSIERSGNYNVLLPSLSFTLQ